jgi:hypothetical protein
MDAVNAISEKLSATPAKASAPKPDPSISRMLAKIQFDATITRPFPILIAAKDVRITRAEIRAVNVEKSAPPPPTAPRVSIGTNSPNYNNIFAATILTGMTANGNTWQFTTAKGLLPLIERGSDIFLNVVLGSTADVFLAEAVLIGYEDETP